MGQRWVMSAAHLAITLGRARASPEGMLGMIEGPAKCRPWRPMTRSKAANEFDVWFMYSTHSIVFTTSMTVPSRYSTTAAGLVVLSMGARAGA